jgi:hypothetical protein
VLTVFGRIGIADYVANVPIMLAGQIGNIIDPPARARLARGSFPSPLALHLLASCE